MWSPPREDRACVAASVPLGAVRTRLADVVVTARLAAIVRAAAAADIAHVVSAHVTGHRMRLAPGAGACKPVSDPGKASLFIQWL